MADSSLVPEIRFEGFADSWKQRKLGEVASSITTGKLDANAAVDNGEYPFFTTAVKTYRTDTYSFDADAILVAGNGPIGYIKEYCGKFDAYQREYVISGFGNYEKSFIAASMKRAMPERVASATYGSAMPYITLDALTDMQLAIPASRKEQRQIGAFFAQLDSLITLHQRKCDKLRLVKESLLEKMFPKPGCDVPEVRFDGFTASWEQRKLGEMATVLGGNAWKSADYCENGEYLVVTIANVKGSYFIDDNIGNRITVRNPGEYLLRKSDILISLTGNVGRVSRMTSENAVLNQRVGKISVCECADDEYVFQVLRSSGFIRAMEAAGQGAAQMNISNSDVLNYEFWIPEVNEQKRLGSFFAQLDNLITLHQRKLEALKKMKSAMLSKMFV